MHRLLTLAVLTLILYPATQSVAFTYADFSSTAGLNLTGSAAQSGTALRLTPASTDQFGAAWLSTKQYLGAGFTTSFTFRISNAGGIAGGGDGLSFAIQNQSSTVAGSEYGAISNKFFGISFNSFFNAGSEPSANFVGVVTNVFPNGVAQWATQVDLNVTPIYLKDGSAHTANIYYYNNLLSLTLDGISIIQNFNIPLTSGVDPSNYGWVGFGARTGGAYENADVLSWTMVPEPGCASILLIGFILAAKREMGRKL